MSASAIKGTMDAMSSAGRVVSGIAAAGKSVVDQVAASADTRRIDSKPASSSTTASEKTTPGGDGGDGSD